jgi:hypothetical protein
MKNTIFLHPLVLVFVSFGLFISSLFFTAFECGERDASGLDLLGAGWLGILMKNIAWYANPLYFIALCFLLFRQNKIAIGLCSTALLISLNTFTATRYAFNEATDVPILAFGPAVPLWFSSMIVCLLGGLIRWKISVPPPLPINHD